MEHEFTLSQLRQALAARERELFRTHERIAVKLDELDEPKAKIKTLKVEIHDLKGAIARLEQADDDTHGEED